MSERNFDGHFAGDENSCLFALSTPRHCFTAAHLFPWRGLSAGVGWPVSGWLNELRNRVLGREKTSERRRLKR